MQYMMRQIFCRCEKRIFRNAKEHFNLENMSSSGNKDLSLYSLVGLTIAGIGMSLLTTEFGVFHVDVFLKAYQLPLSTYSTGNIVFSVINTANDVAGAWLVDHVAVHRNRIDLVAVTGIVFCLCFLTPFFRWETPNPTWDGLHFVCSLSLYDTMYSFTAILLGSIVTDNHHMSDRTRVLFMAVGKIVNLLASFIVTRVGLALFDTSNLHSFRVFLLVVACAVAGLFVVAQWVIHGRQGLCETLLASGPPESYKKSDEKKSVSSTLKWKQVLVDFWRHKNFRAWIGMEMLLEAQMTFISFFLKTFVDGLLLEAGGVSRENCDWLISWIRPLGKLVAVSIYVPIRRFGYVAIYKIVLTFNLILASAMFLFANESNLGLVVAFLILFPVFTGAVQGAGFHLAMSDMITELKRDHLANGRFDEPSVAGMFMGMNALLCKPMESVLPVIAATVLDGKEGSSRASTLYLLLVMPPMVCAVLQLISWNSYNLAPQKTAQIRQQLKELEEESEKMLSQAA